MPTSGSVFARFASALDPVKSTLIASILSVYYQTFNVEGPTAASDWLYNNVGEFWSPSFRNALNKKGRRIFDAVDIKLIGDNDGEYSSIERCILFMFEQDVEALRMFIDCSRKGSCSKNTIYSIRNPSELKTYLKGGSNTNTVMLEYSKHMRYQSRIVLVRDILAAFSVNGKHSAYYLVRHISKNMSFQDDLHFSPHVDAYDPYLIVRFLLRQKTNVLTRLAKKTA